MESAEEDDHVWNAAEFSGEVREDVLGRTGRQIVEDDELMLGQPQLLG